jgi:replicative DNA helicase
MSEKRKGIDLLTVGEELSKRASRAKNKTQLDDVGGSIYLDDCYDHCKPISHSEGWVEEIINNSKLRQIIRSVHEVSQKCHQKADVSTVVSDVIADLGHISGRIKYTESTKEELKKNFLEHAVGAKNGVIYGIPTQFPSINSVTGGAKKREITILMGGNGVRKSWMMSGWAYHASVVEGISGCYQPLEDGQDTGFSRMTCMAAGVDSSKINSGYYSQEELDRCNEQADILIKKPITIAQARGMSMEKRRLDIIEGIDKYGWEYIIIDSWKDVCPTNDVSENNIRISQLTDIAVEFNIAIILGLHVVKYTENKQQLKDKDDPMRNRLTKFDAKGSENIMASCRLCYALQCQLIKGDKYNYFDNYVLEVVKANNTKMPTVPLNINQNTGQFTESNREAFSLWDGIIDPSGKPY